MNGLSDSLTIGLVLALVFGALCFYLYTRIGQMEKRVSLTENILLDLKIATENTIMSMAAPPGGSQGSWQQEHEVDHQVGEQEQNHEEAHGQSLDSEVEQVPDEEFYKQVLEQSQSQPQPNEELTPLNDVPTTTAKVDVNYEAMTLKELKALAKQRGVTVATASHKKDVIDALKRNGQNSQSSVLEPVAGSLGSNGLVSADEGYPVELGSTESRPVE
jgi:flagellar motor switch/type III secretory pathway protein FliN